LRNVVSNSWTTISGPSTLNKGTLKRKTVLGTNSIAHSNRKIPGKHNRTFRNGKECHIFNREILQIMKELFLNVGRQDLLEISYITITIAKVIQKLYAFLKTSEYSEFPRERVFPEKQIENGSVVDFP
jgi:hypothetical protein